MEECENLSISPELSSVYTPLDKTRHDIRLLRILPYSQTQGKQYQLVAYNLKNAPSYVALSYEWGSADHARYILVNGHLVPVRNNLWSFLEHRGQDWGVEWIWIDALCINQTDLTERSHQVGLMSKIYSQAARVLAWLGPSLEDSILTSSLFSGPGRTTKDEKSRQLSLGELRTIHCISIKTYWTRLWVLQELVLAREVLLCIGCRLLTWFIFADALDDINTLAQRFDGFDIRLNIKGFMSSTDGLRQAIFDSPACGMLKQMQLGVATVSLLSRVVSMGGRDQPLHCAVSKDRIYALLGICKADSIVPDYSLDEARLAEDLLLRADENAFEDLDEFISKARCVAKALDLSASQLFVLATTSEYYTFQRKIIDSSDTGIAGPSLLCWAVALNNARLQKLCFASPDTTRELLAVMACDEGSLAYLSVLNSPLCRVMGTVSCLSSGQLFHAASTGDVSALQQWLMQAADAEAKCNGQHSMTPLQLASRRGYMSVVCRLLKGGDPGLNLTISVPSPDSQFYALTALMLAAQSGNEHIVRVLLEQSDIDVNYKTVQHINALHLAVLGGHEVVVALLVNRLDLDVNVAVQGSIQGHEGCTALMIAVKSGKQTIVRQLLERRDIEVKCKTLSYIDLLHMAANQGDDAILDMLIKRQDSSGLYNSGHESLAEAIRFGHMSLVRKLLQRSDVEVNCTIGGRSPLQCALEAQHEAIVDLLLERKDIDPYCVGHGADRTTALVLAADLGNVDILHRIIDKLISCASVRSSTEADCKALERRRANKLGTKLDTESDGDTSPIGQIDFVFRQAARQGHQEVVDVIVERAMEPSCRDLLLEAKKWRTRDFSITGLIDAFCRTHWPRIACDMTYNFMAGDILHHLGMHAYSLLLLEAPEHIRQQLLVKLLQIATATDHNYPWPNVVRAILNLRRDSLLEARELDQRELYSAIRIAMAGQYLNLLVCLYGRLPLLALQQVIWCLDPLSPKLRCNHEQYDNNSLYSHCHVCKQRMEQRIEDLIEVEY